MLVSSRTNSPFNSAPAQSPQKAAPKQVSFGVSAQNIGKLAKPVEDAIAIAAAGLKPSWVARCKKLIPGAINIEPIKVNQMELEQAFTVLANRGINFEKPRVQVVHALVNPAGRPTLHPFTGFYQPFIRVTEGGTGNRTFADFATRTPGKDGITPINLRRAVVYQPQSNASSAVKA